MAELSKTAQRQIEALTRDFVRKLRVEAVLNLRQAVIAAERAVDDPTTAYRRFPGRYESLSRPGVRWILIHIYWISYRVESGSSVITNVFWQQANIPGRYRPARLRRS